jgi:hypothetical protein
MKIQYTAKLFHKKFAYKVVLSCQTSGSRWFWPSKDTLAPDFQTVTDWCELHAPNAHKIQRRYQGGTDQHSEWHQNVYLQTDKQKDALVKAQGAAVQEIWQPLDADHLQSLDVRNIVEVRKRLIYGKYAHVIYFKYDRDQKIRAWLTAILEGSTTSVLKGQRFWCIVYSTDQDDVRMIQLSYPERIDYIKHVKLLPP